MANKKIDPVKAGIVGAVVGAAVGATAAALSDKETRKKLGNEFKKIEKEGEKVLGELETGVKKEVNKFKKK